MRKTGERKVIPKYYPDRSEIFEEIADKMMSVLDEEYEISALDFIQLTEYIKNSGLKRFYL